MLQNVVPVEYPMKNRPIQEGFMHVTEERYVRINTEKPPYRQVGRGGRNKKGESMNLISEMGIMSKPELWLISELEAALDYKTNEARLVTSELSGTHRGYLTKGYKA